VLRELHSLLLDVQSEGADGATGIGTTAAPTAGAAIRICAARFHSVLGGACGTSVQASREADRILFLVRERNGGAWVDCAAFRAGEPATVQLFSPASTMCAVLRLGRLVSGGAVAQPESGRMLIREAIEEAWSAGTISGRDPIAQQLADNLRNALLRAGSTAPPSACSRAERMLQALARGFPVGLAPALARVNQGGAANVTELLDRLEAVLKPQERSGSRIRVAILVVCGGE
jgi:hypothetical protein